MHCGRTQTTLSLVDFLSFRLNVVLVFLLIVAVVSEGGLIDLLEMFLFLFLARSKDHVGRRGVGTCTKIIVVPSLDLVFFVCNCCYCC